MNINEFLGLLKKVKKSGSGYVAQCPAHRDDVNSLSVTATDDRILLNCHALCSPVDVCSSLGLGLKDLFFNNDLQKKSLKETFSKIEKIYSYQDENWITLYENVRYASKVFRQRRPDGFGGYIYNLDGVRKVPFLLPELIQDLENKPEEPVLLCEGEKDVLNVRQYLKFISSNSKSWKQDFNKFISSRDVVIICDHDVPGLRLADNVARIIGREAKTLKIVDLFPDVEVPDKHGPDISDWISAGGSTSNLKNIIEKTPSIWGVINRAQQDVSELTPKHGQVNPIFESERLLLGIIIFDNSFFISVYDGLKPENFYYPAHQKIFRAMESLFNSGGVIDAVLLSQEVNKQSGPPNISVEAIKNLSKDVPVFSDNTIKIHIDRVYDAFQTRRLLKAANNISTKCVEQKESFSELVSYAENQIFSLNEASVDTDFYKADSIVNESIARVVEITQTGEQAMGIGTGFIDIDNKTLGLQRTNLIIIAARPSVGKTALMVSYARNAAFSQDKKIAVFSLEMSKEEMASRIICSEARVNSEKYRRGDLNHQEWEKINYAKTLMLDKKLFINFTPAINPAFIRAKMMRLVSQHGPFDGVLVDYLQLMTSTRNTNSRQEEVASISRELKQLAKDFNVPLVALSQLNRDPERRQNHRPTMADLRESGAIEQDADVVKFIYREDMYQPPGTISNNVAEIIIAKQRNGPTGTVFLRFDRPTTTFDNYISDF